MAEELTKSELKELEGLANSDEPWSDAIAAYLEAYNTVTD